MDLYHGTTLKALDRILKTKLKDCYWGTERVATYYAEVTAEEDGSSPVLLVCSLDCLEKELLQPDMNSIAEPLTYTLKMSEEEVWEEWEDSDQEWEDSLSIVESVFYKGEVKDFEVILL